MSTPRLTALAILIAAALVAAVALAVPLMPNGLVSFFTHLTPWS